MNLYTVLLQIINNVNNQLNSENIARDTACHSEYPLEWERANGIRSILGEEDQCNAYWKAAQKIMLTKLKDAPLQRAFRDADRLIVKDLDITCYRPELFRNKGWCKLPRTDPGKWGFCSSGCKVNYMKVLKWIRIEKEFN